MKRRATNTVDIPKCCWLMAIVLSIADRMVVGSGVVMAPTVSTGGGGVCGIYGARIVWDQDSGISMEAAFWQASPTRL